MSDLISRQAAIDRATKEHDFFRGAVTVSDKARRDELLNVMCWLGELPSIQPEIVRCGECKWFQCNMRPDGYLPQGVDEFECRHWCGSCDPTDFCSYAERRTNG